MSNDALYKSKYIIAFYEKDDDTLKYIFDNPRQICQALNLPINRKNMNMVLVNLYRSLRRSNHQTNLFRRQCLKVYMIDVVDDEIE